MYFAVALPCLLLRLLHGGCPQQLPIKSPGVRLAWDHGAWPEAQSLLQKGDLMAMAWSLDDF